MANDFSNVLQAYYADSRKVGEGLADAAAILTKADPTDALMFKGGVVSLAIKTAKASGKRFGDKASKDEKVAIAYIGTVLNFDPEEFNRVAPTYQRS
jgi:hypothetical protein